MLFELFDENLYIECWVLSNVSFILDAGIDICSCVTNVILGQYMYGLYFGTNGISYGVEWNYIRIFLSFSIY
jgi:hypothetical protein